MSNEDIGAENKYSLGLRMEELDFLKNLDSKSGKLIRPFRNEIFLLEAPIMGMQHVEDIEERLLDLKEGDELLLLREPENPYDDKAILVLNKREEKLGYVPRRNNTILANLMDGGKELKAVLTDQGSSYRAYGDQSTRITIYLVD